MSKRFQAFERGQRVRIVDTLPSCMDHFPCGMEAIIEGSYHDLYGGGNTSDWSVYLINPKTGKIYNHVSWYKTYQLTLIDSDEKNGVKMIRAYQRRGY